ncbi:MAG: hypothetical protein K9K62_08040 [Desulfobacteraceae bacterium]|nr:hypothetical protein [Desulfobacteraceae bacterium]
MYFLTQDSIRQGLAKAQQQETSLNLGDRTAYVGASDIGQCTRKAILSKTSPRAPSLQDLIRFARGHLAEEILASALQDVRPERQVELSADIPYCWACHWWDFYTPAEPAHCPNCGNPIHLVPIKAHCDFVFDDDLVLECKSSPLVGIQDSWEMQLQTQMLLYEHCLQKSSQGVILVMDLAGGALQITDPYVLDPNKVGDIIRRAITIWKGVVEASSAPDPESLDLKTEPGPLCGWCEYLGTCPAFKGEELPDDLVTFFEQYQHLCRAEKAAKAEKDTLRDQVLAMLEPGKYVAGDLRISLFNRSRTTTDIKALGSLLEELGQDITEFQNTSPYQVLDVKSA